MKIALVHDFLIKLGGAENTLLEISKIFPDAPIYTILYDKWGTKGLFSNKKIITSSLQSYPKFIRDKSRLLLTKFPSAIEEFDFHNYDIVISDSNSFSHGIITPKETFHVTYCYSPTRYIWDWYHEYLDENNIKFSILGVYIRSRLSKIRIWDFNASKRTDFWIAISDNVKNRIRKYYRKNSDVIYPPVDVEKFYPSDNSRNNYYLIVSRLSPYKNIELAVKAFNNNKKKLKIVGEGSEFSKLKSTANQNIEFLGWQSQDTIIKLYSNCKALIFPGEEDFGLTPIEAMASGKPVIALNKGGVKESVIDNKTGIFFNNSDYNDLNQAISIFEKKQHNFNSDYIRNHSKKFSNKIFYKNFRTKIIHQYQNFLSGLDY